MPSKKPEIFIVTGKINSGKSSLLLQIAELEKSQSHKLIGIIAKGVFDNNKKIGFDIVDLSTGKTKLLARTDLKSKNTIKAGKYTFSNNGFKFAQNALMKFKPGGVVFLDEVGPLELSGQGYAENLKLLADSDISRMYLAVREECLNEVIGRFFNRRKINIINTNDIN